MGGEVAHMQDGRLRPSGQVLRLRWRLGQASAQDAQALSIGFGFALRAIDHPAQLQMLEETFGRNPVSAAAVRDHFEPALRQAAESVMEQKSIEHWLGAAGRADLLEVLRSAVQSVAFVCGLEILAPFELELSRPMSQQQRLAALVEQVEAATPSTVWLVAGNHLLTLDTAPLRRGQTPQAEPTPLPTDCGPLRSVQAARLDGRLLLVVGARCGVLLVDPLGKAAPVAYQAPSNASMLGFNRAVIRQRQLWGCHGETGLVCWMLGQPGQPTRVLRPDELPGPPRHLQLLEDQRLVLSCGSALVCIGEDGTVRVIDQGSAQIVGLFEVQQRLACVQADGTVVLRRLSDLSAQSHLRLGGSPSAAGLMPWLGQSRLLLADGDGPLLCADVEDCTMVQYLSAYRGLRAAVGAADVIAALSPDRQRLVLWTPQRPQEPAADLCLVSLTHHRLADVEAG